MRIFGFRLNWLALALVIGLAGCSEPETTPPPPIRPVLSLVASTAPLQTNGYAGSIEPRFTTDLAFRVLGRLVARDVDVGDEVKVGQRVAAIDPLTQELGVRAAQGDLSKAQAQLESAASSEARKRELLARNVGTQADVDQAEQARQAADAAVTQARSALAKARELLGYTQIVSDMDGVVTSVAAEIGQQVPAGQTVMTVARVDVREAVVDIPEGDARLLDAGAPFSVALQIDPSVTAKGRIREIAPEFDARTGTRRIKITLANSPTAFRVGTTITATPVETDKGALRLPRSAVLEKDGKRFVWVLTPKDDGPATKVAAPKDAGAPAPASGTAISGQAARGQATVSLHEIEVADPQNRMLSVTKGLQPGARVVSAGVHSLTEGQTVKLGEGLEL